MKTHELKTWPAYFKAIKEGRKTFDIRENDRNFQVGDTIILKEFKPCKRCDGQGQYMDYTDGVTCECMSTKFPMGKFTGKTLKRKIIYLIKAVPYNSLVEGNIEAFGLTDNYCVMALK